MISYTPLRELMIEKNLKWKDLRERLGIAPTVIAKINKNEYVSLEILERICLHFNCQLSDICTIKKNV